MGWRLRPTGGRILPFLLPAIRCQIEEMTETCWLDATAGGEIGAIDMIIIAQKDAEAKILLTINRDAHIGIEAAASR